MMPTEPISASPSPSSYSQSSQTTQQHATKRSTSTRLSQKIRSLRHLRLGGVGNTEHQTEPDKKKQLLSPEPEFKIVHTPDRPSRLVSPLEAPSEEQCFDEIKGWHSAAAAAEEEEEKETSLELEPEPEREIEPEPGFKLDKGQEKGLPLLPPVEVEGPGLGLGLGLSIELGRLGWDTYTGPEQEQEQGQHGGQERGYMPTETKRAGYIEAHGQGPGHGDIGTATENNDTGTDTGKGKEILQPRVYYPRRDSFVSVSVASSSDEDEEDEGGQKNHTKGKEKEIEPWESRSPPAAVVEHEKFTRLISYTPPSATNSKEKLSFQGPRSDTETPEEQFKLELDDESLPGLPPGEERPPHELAQMQQLWSHLRKVKSQGAGPGGPGGIGRTETGTGISGSSRASGFSCFSASGESDDGYAYSHDAEIHTAQVVNLELRRNMERFREGWCPYCGKRVEEKDRGESHCRRCFADLRGVRGAFQAPQAVNTVPVVPQQRRRRPERGYDSGRPFVTSRSSLGRTASPSPKPRPPKPLRERAILDQGLDARRSRKGSRNNLRGERETSQGAGEDIFRTNSAPPNTGRGPYSDVGYQNSTVLTSTSKPQPVPYGTSRDEKPAETSSKFSYTSSYASSSSSSLSQPKQKAPPRLADRPVLQEATKLGSASTTSLSQQLRHRPPPPPPQRVVYAKDLKVKRGKQPQIQNQQPQSITAKKTVVSPNLNKQQPTPSPLRHEIKGPTTAAARKQETHYSGPLLPSTVYRPLPLPAPPAPAPTTGPLPSRRPLPPNSKTTVTPLLPRSVQSPSYVVPSSPGITSTSRPNQSRPLNPEQLQPVPHRPNHPAPLSVTSLAPARPSPPLPGPPPPRPSLMPAASLTAVEVAPVPSTVPVRARQDSPVFLPQTRYQPHVQPQVQPNPSGPIMALTPNKRPVRPPLHFTPGLPSDPKPNLLASASEQARTANGNVNVNANSKQQQSPQSASSSNYSPYADSPTVNSTSTFPANTAISSGSTAFDSTSRTDTNTNTSTGTTKGTGTRTETATEKGAPQIPLSTISTLRLTDTSTSTGGSGSDSTVSNPFATPPMSNSQFQSPFQVQGPTQTQKGNKNVEITPSSAQVPVFRYDSWMTPEYKAEYERLIAETGDNADLYMDIFDDYAGEGDEGKETDQVNTQKRGQNQDTGRGTSRRQAGVAVGLGISNNDVKRVAWDLQLHFGGLVRPGRHDVRAPNDDGGELTSSSSSSSSSDSDPSTLALELPVASPKSPVTSPITTPKPGGRRQTAEGRRQSFRA
ncbi:hypothetical protein V8F20_000897 [Naviculisporaceae sp. PSN 640]